MTEKATPNIPYPEVDAAAGKYAAEYAHDKAYDRQLRFQLKQGNVGLEVLRLAEGVHAKKNWLGRKLGESSLGRLRDNVREQVNAFDLRDGALNSIGIGLNIVDSRQHASDHLDEYIANGIEQAKAEGVHIVVQQPDEAPQSIEVHQLNAK